MPWPKVIAVMAAVIPLAFAEAQNGVSSLIRGVSVITRATDPSSGTVEQGSGVVVDASRGIILCTYHQVKGLSTIFVETETTGDAISADLLQFDEKLDIALLETAEPLLKAAPIGDAGTLTVLDDVYAVTTPIDLKYQYTKGSVTNLSVRDNGALVFLVNMTLEAGSSGGPVFNKHGKVVGIVTKSLDDQPGIFVAAQINSAYPMLRMADVPIPSGELANAQIIPSHGVTGDDLAAMSHFNRGVRSSSNHFKIEQYALAVERSENFFEAWFNYAFALEKADLHEQSRAAYGHARQLRPDSPHVCRNLGLLLLKPPFENFSEAEDMFRTLVQHRPRSPKSHNFLGESLRRQRKFPEAVKSFENAIREDGDYAYAYFNLAYTHLELGNLGKAREYFDKYQRLKPNAKEFDEFEAAMGQV